MASSTSADDRRGGASDLDACAGKEADGAPRIGGRQLLTREHHFPRRERLVAQAPLVGLGRVGDDLPDDGGEVVVEAEVVPTHERAALSTSGRPSITRRTGSRSARSQLQHRTSLTPSCQKFSLEHAGTAHRRGRAAARAAERHTLSRTRPLRGSGSPTVKAWVNSRRIDAGYSVQFVSTEPCSSGTGAFDVVRVEHEQRVACRTARSRRARPSMSKLELASAHERVADHQQVEEQHRQRVQVGGRARRGLAADDLGSHEAAGAEHGRGGLRPSMPTLSLSQMSGRPVRGSKNTLPKLMSR